MDKLKFSTRKFMSLLRPNLDTKGRLLRGASALALATGALFISPYSRAASLAMAASAFFVAFEAARGWCALRACGVKTKF
jgi:hypothetical protein